MAFAFRPNFPALARPEAHHHRGTDLDRASVGTDQLAAASVTAAKLASEAWTAYAPVLTASISDPTGGTGFIQNGRYTRMGRTITGHARFRFGTSGAAAGSGNYQLSLPVTAMLSGTLNIPVGGGWLYDSSAAAINLVTALIDQPTGGTKVILVVEGAGVVNDVSPWIWANTDEILISFTYEASS